MEMKMFLLASAMALLVCPAGTKSITSTTPKPVRILKLIIDLALEYSKGVINKDVFVEDLSSLVDEGCRDTFFCKGHHILHNKNEKEMRIAGHIKKFIDGRNQNCTELINKVPSSNVTMTVHKLMDQLIDCSRRRYSN